MRRFFTLVCLLCLAVPAGISVSGCYRNPGANYCNGLGYGAKIGAVASITLQPQTTGISLAFGQTQQISTPTAFDCKGSSTGSSSFSYGTTNNNLVDISPSGMICAGTWNRNTGGGVADYTICNKPTTLPVTNGLPYSTAYITASADSVTSNPVKVFVHTQITSIALAGSDQCYSQTSTAQLDSQACYAGSDGKQYLFCAPASLAAAKYACPMNTAAGVTSVPTCSAALGALTYALGSSSIGTINSETNIITASQPGTTNLTATIAGSASSAGYFSVCPPASLSLKTASGATTATVTQGVTQTLATSMLDTSGNTITGVALDYSSSNPMDINVSGGSITASHPGIATIFANCQPTNCNPSPVNEIGLYGTGLPISSNGVTITTPGTTSNYVWFAAPNYSQYLVNIDLLNGTSGSTTKLPYVPNSMVMDKTGSSLYFGSIRELMIVSTSSNTVTKQDPNVPGVVLSVSPSNGYALINDQVRNILYVYNVSSGSAQSFSGKAVAAAWTADSHTLYAVDSSSLNVNGDTGHTDTLYVYSLNTGWSTFDLSAEGGAWAVTALIPGVGAYLGGPITQARSWCPAGAVGSSANMVLYPQVEKQSVQIDTLATTNDGNHVLGATQTASGVMLTDLGITIPTTTVGSITVPASCTPAASKTAPANGGTLSSMAISSTLKQLNLGSLGSTAVSQLVTSPVSNLTFLTYKADSSNTGAPLVYYLPGTKGTMGTTGTVALTGAAKITAPLAGAFSPDNSLFFVSTAGDNKIHFLTIPSSVSTSNPPTDTKQMSPALPACSATTDSGCTYKGSDTVVPATVITVIPRATT